MNSSGQKIIKQKYKIKAPIEKIWEALVVPAHIDGWGGGAAKMSDRAGAKFSLWDGAIWGKNIEVVRFKRLKQEWYGGEWKKPSILTILLDEKGGITTAELTHENVPNNEITNIGNGWKEYYMGPLKRYVEKNQGIT